MRKKFLAYSMVALMGIWSLVGCGNTTNNSDSGNTNTEDSNTAEDSIEANTPATKLQVQFLETVADTKDTEELAQKLCENAELTDISMATMPVEEGLLNGFDGEISGFSKGVMFAPMIGTIPFVGYIFETDDVESLKSSLESQAMLNWNLCTTADEMVVDSADNIVFFVMAPNSFDE